MLYSEINGQVAEQVSITDRGFNYGDGVFTTAKISQGKVELLNRHMLRLQKSCEALGILSFSRNDTRQQTLRTRLQHLAKSYELAVIKVVITAGQGGRGYSRQGCSEPNIIISASEFPEHYITWQAQGITLGLSQQKIGVSPMLAEFKHLNRLEQVLIRQELDQSEFNDLLVLNVENHVVETSCANIFLLKGEQCVTSDLTKSGVAGLMRAEIIANQQNVQIKPVSIEDMLEADGLFISNSVMGIVAVKSFAYTNAEQKNYDLSFTQDYISQLQISSDKGLNCG